MQCMVSELITTCFFKSSPPRRGLGILPRKAIQIDHSFMLVYVVLPLPQVTRTKTSSYGRKIGLTQTRLRPRDNVLQRVTIQRIVNELNRHKLK
jgi:hypothetical protein